MNSRWNGNITQVGCNILSPIFHYSSAQLILYGVSLLTTAVGLTVYELKLQCQKFPFINLYHKYPNFSKKNLYIHKDYRESGGGRMRLFLEHTNTMKPS